MKRPAYIPKDYKRIKVVKSENALHTAQFGGRHEVNCIVQPRTLSADFNALAQALISPTNPFYLGERSGYGIEKEQLILQSKKMPESVQPAIDFILADMDRALAEGFYVSVWLIPPRGHQDNASVYKYHHDDVGFPEKGRLISCYTGPATLFLRNEDAVPDMLASQDADVGLYESVTTATAHSFAIGDIWRQVSRPDIKGMPPFIHRADPQGRAINEPRLMLVAS